MNDDKAINKLVTDGWNVITVWECELKSDRREETLNRLYQQIVNLK